MNYLILLVVHDVEKFEDVLKAWRDAGVSGVTVLPSIGMQRLDDERALREDMPLLPMLSSLFEQDQVLNRTLFSIVEGDDLVDRVVAATTTVLGDLDEPNTGVMTVVPVSRVYGLHRRDNH
jgi:hypothetical protein